jgi:hypothetical protein
MPLLAIEAKSHDFEPMERAPRRNLVTISIVRTDNEPWLATEPRDMTRQAATTTPSEASTGAIRPPAPAHRRAP